MKKEKTLVGVSAVMIIAGLVLAVAINFMIRSLEQGMTSATHWMGLAILVSMLAIFEFCFGLIVGWVLWDIGT